MSPESGAFGKLYMYAQFDTKIDTLKMNNEKKGAPIYARKATSNADGKEAFPRNLMNRSHLWGKQRNLRLQKTRSVPCSLTS